jgi:NADPH:quinone reductase-like Zn-dependent oxidoreductase
MMTWLIKNRIAAFERQFGYDASYLRELLAIDPRAFWAFAKVQKMKYRRDVPRDVYYAASITAAMAEDCGPCTQLVVGMALGEGSTQTVIGNIVAGDLVALPDDVSFEAGAAIPVNYATAWAALSDYARVRARDRVLIHAAAGGVGIAATQIAKRAGAELWGTASPGKHDAIRGFGIDHPLDYRQEGWERGLPPFDVILDALGGRSLRRSYRMLRVGGRLVAFGASSVVSGERRNYLRAAPEAVAMLRGFDLIDQMHASKAVIGLNVLTLWDDRGTLEPWIAPLRELLADGTLRPVVHEAVPFDRAADAHRIIQERRNVGKVVLVP